MTDFSKEAQLPEKLNYNAAVAETAGQIEKLLKSAPAVIRPMTRHLSGASGKMIRAKALLACALNQQNSVSPEAAKAAVAVELLHLATLVHDDIIDQADKRRGKKALYRVFGEKYAVLCGDWLLCTALEQLSTLNSKENSPEEISRVFPQYMTEVCIGEVRQNQNSRNYRLSERQYYRTIRGKTAALFEACFYAGYIFSGEPPHVKDTYKEIGNAIGIIFQLADDCADYESTRKTAKKPVLSDFRSGVVTLPLIYALKTDKTLKEQIAAGIDPSRLKDAVAAAGGLGYAHAKIDRLYKKTADLTNSLQISPYKSGLLAQLLSWAAGKTFKQA